MSNPPSAIFHRSLTKAYPTAVTGQGVYLITSDGRKILDGSCGAAVSCLGHGHKVVIEAIVEQTRSLAFAHTSFFTSNPSEELASLLLASSDGAFSKAMFLSSGSEAVESAIKLARQYHVSDGATERTNIIARKFSYHGNTLGALSAGYNPSRREAFIPLLSPAFHHVSPCFHTRDGQLDEDEDEYVDRLMEEFEAMFLSLGTHTVAAVIVEPVVGATLGSVPAAKGYLRRLKQLCEAHGALLIFDEVMCGMGRAGTMHAWQSLGGAAPDLQTIGKGLGAGYQPISAVLVGERVHSKLLETSSSHAFISGHTYQGHAIGCAAALATQRVIVREDLMSNVVSMSELLVGLLRQHTPFLKEVRGIGLFQTVEFLPILPDRRSLAKEVSEACLQNGAAVYLCSSAVDAVLFAPPFIITESETKALVDIFTSTVQQVLRSRGQGRVLH